MNRLKLNDSSCFRQPIANQRINCEVTPSEDTITHKSLTLQQTKQIE